MRRKVAVAVVLLVIALWTASFFSPEWAIRRYMFLHLHPVSAVTSDITDLGKFFAMDGHLYHATDYKDRATGGEISFFYLEPFA